MDCFLTTVCLLFTLFLQRKCHSIDHLAKELRVTLKTFSSLTYNCTGEHQHLLMDVHTKLRELMANFESQLPRERGLLLRPELRRKMKLSRQKKLALARSSQLKPTLKRG